MSMQFGSRALSFNSPYVMGVINTTPDSFSDGGRYYNGQVVDIGKCMARVALMVEQGATFIDIGGESTRPGAKAVGCDEELRRVIPVIEAVAKRFDVLISVDTSNPQVMLEAAKVGVNMINDVRALRQPGALSAAALTGLPVCLMHMQGQPETMQEAPSYVSVIDEVRDFFAGRIKACAEAGISEDRLVLDPGIGFGKTDAQNIALLKAGKNLMNNRCPWLVGVSRKSMIGRLLDREIQDRLAGSLAFAYAAVVHGANILRVHDVAETIDVVNVFKLMEEKRVYG